MSSSIPAGFRLLQLPIAQLSLAAVLKCGQSFRWSAYPLSSPSAGEVGATPTHEYRLCLQDRVICLRQVTGSLFYKTIFPDGESCVAESSQLAQKRENETLAFIQDYFQLQTDLLKLYEEWSIRDPVFRGLRHRFEGIRILRQDPWENIVSFICSSNNNISRITKMVQSLCTHFSPPLVQSALPMPLSDGGDDLTSTATYHPFPPPSALAGPSVSGTLRNLGFGYRAEYIQRTAQMLIKSHGSDDAAMRWLATLRTINTDDARAELLKFVGVGRKVADCILLMSLDKSEVIPVDTHVHQIAIKHYGFRGPSGKAPMTPKLYEELSSKLSGVWGSFGGWAHSVLFTADLRAFSNYGLPTPSPSPEKKKQTSPSKPKPILSPSPSPSRKRRTIEKSVDFSKAFSTTCEAVSLVVSTMAEGTLADRVKKRQRVSPRKTELQPIVTF